jgi:hypothetical protein
MEKRLEFEKLVPRFTQRPTKLSQRFDSSVAYNFIFLTWKPLKLEELLRFASYQQKVEMGMHYQSSLHSSSQERI